MTPVHKVSTHPDDPAEVAAPFNGGPDQVMPYRYPLEGQPASIRGLHTIYGLSKPRGMETELASRRFSDWVCRLNAETWRKYGYDWRILSSACYTPRPVDRDTLIDQLDGVMAEIACFPDEPFAPVSHGPLIDALP